MENITNFMEDYEKLLDDVYKKIKPVECSERFEILGVEGHHEGGKTIIINFQQIARHLRRHPQHLAKFLFKELATSGEIAGDRLILIRKVSSQRINEKIKEYTGEYVLCDKCKKPDTELIEEAGKKFLRCLACGNKKQIV